MTYRSTYIVASFVAVTLCTAAFTTFSSTSAVAEDEAKPEGSMVQNRGVIDFAPAPGRVSCSDAYRLLAAKGYSDIASFDCVGQLYRFNVRKGDKPMTVLMNAESAGYVEVY